ncbi:mate-domain-containing protein [Dichotomocladium elegans]|nr:mate-domain-containing protein [Dichotomocladium elegans]
MNTSNKQANEATYLMAAHGRSHTLLLSAITAETKALALLAWPLLITYVVGYGMRLTDVWFLGRLGTEVMAVVSLSGLWTTVAGLAMGNGLLTAIDTLVAQAFTAAEYTNTLGIILQRGLVVISILAVPTSILWLFAEPILICIGQDPSLARRAQEYIYFCIPLIYIIFVSTALRKFLQSLGNTQITMYMILTLFPLNLLSNMIWLQYLQYWPGWSSHAFHHLKPFLKLGIPGMLSVSTDWAFEICALVTGTLGKTMLAGQSIVLCVNSLLMMVISSLSSAVLVRIGHHLGGGETEKIKLCFFLAAGLGIGIATVNALLMYCLRHSIASHFATDADVVQAAVDLFPAACLSHWFTGVSVIFSAVLNALGKQAVVASFNLGSYYVIGLPFGLWMTYAYDWGLVGVWSGVVIAGAIKCIGESALILLRVDWETECQKAHKVISSQETLGKTLSVAKNGRYEHLSSA